jgi:hypothetical protein
MPRQLPLTLICQLLGIPAELFENDKSFQFWPSQLLNKFPFFRKYSFPLPLALNLSSIPLTSKG